MIHYFLAVAKEGLMPVFYCPLPPDPDPWPLIPDPWPPSDNQ